MSGQGGGTGLEQLLGMLGGGQGGAQGLGALVDRLRQGGLGDEVDSWVGTGANKPVAPDRLEGVFGQDELSGLAQRFGAGGGGGIAAVLAALLPQLISGLTPQGRVPQSDAELGGGGVGGLLSQVMGAVRGDPQGGGGLGALLGGTNAEAGASGGGLGAMLGALMGHGPAAAPGKPGLDDDDGAPLPQKPPPLR